MESRSPVRTARARRSRARHARAARASAEWLAVRSRAQVRALLQWRLLVSVADRGRGPSVARIEQHALEPRRDRAPALLVRECAAALRESVCESGVAA